MIEVTCPSSRRNNHTHLYALNKNMGLIMLKIDSNGVAVELELSVSEAEQAANDLMEWVNELKGAETK